MRKAFIKTASVFFSGLLILTKAPLTAQTNVTFTDLTYDALTPDPANTNWLTQTTNIQPDQHALVFSPANPDLWFEGSDGGLVRSSGQYASISFSCVNRGLTGDALTTCQRLLSAVPTKNLSLNSGLVTLQFQNFSINPNNPLGGCKVVPRTTARSSSRAIRKPGSRALAATAASPDSMPAIPLTDSTPTSATTPV